MSIQPDPHNYCAVAFSFPCFPFGLTESSGRERERPMQRRPNVLSEDDEGPSQPGYKDTQLLLTFRLRSNKGIGRRLRRHSLRGASHHADGGLNR